MTRKDYVLIAEAIQAEHAWVQENRAVLGSCVDAQLFRMKETAGRIAGAMAQDNPRFDRERFMQACGFEG